MSTVAAAFVCARCGETLDSTDPTCGSCTGIVPRVVLPDVRNGPLGTGARPASPERRAVSCAVAVLAPLALGAAVAVALWPLGAAAAVAWAAASVVVLAVVELVVWLRTGRSIGGVVTTTRTVRADDGTALSWSALRSPFDSRSRALAGADISQGALGRLLGATTVVVRGRADPLVMSVDRVGPLPAPVRRTATRVAAPHAVTLVFDERMRIPLIGALVLGRGPAAGDVAVVALPDMSRSISKAHVRLDRDDAGRLFAQDLGSTNGTELVTEEGAVELVPGRRVEMPAGAHLLLAGLPLRVDTRETAVRA